MSMGYLIFMAGFVAGGMTAFYCMARAVVRAERLEDQQ